MRVFRYILALVLLCAACSCIMILDIDNDPRWKVSFKYNKAKENLTFRDDPSPKGYEYSIPEFFIMDDGQVVYRFYFKNRGFKLQFANIGPFVYGKRYYFTGKEEYFDVSFHWVLDYVKYTCNNGWVEFHPSNDAKISYTVKFEFDLVSPEGKKMQIRDGVFTVYEIIKPRNTDVGLTKDQ